MSEDIRTETETQTQRDSTIRDSVITYSTDVVGSSIADTQTNETFSTKPKSIHDDSPPFYRRKRFWAIFIALSVVFAIIAIPLIVLVIFPAVAQKTVNNSKLELSSIVITSPNNESFIMSSSGNVTNGGSFRSTITFQSPVTMFWEGVEIGNVEFDPIHVSGGSATTNISNKTFIVTNETGLADFSVALLKDEDITITFKSTVSVKSLGITKGGISLDKEITLPGANKLGTPKVTGFFINQPDNSTLMLNVTVLIFNPSVFSIYMGKLGLGVSYNGTFIANMITEDFMLTPGNLSVTMIGNASVPESADDRANFGTIMSAYLTNKPVNTTATGQFAYPDQINPVSWLTPTVRSLTLNAAIGDAPNGPPQLITGLNFGSPSFNFTPGGITLSTNGTVATYKLPFHVSTDIQQISQDAILYSGGVPLATFNTTQFPVKDDLHGSLTFNIPPTSLNVYPGSEKAFEIFVAEMSALNKVTFNVTGSSNVLANTVIGPLPIPNLPFTLNVSLDGFSGFNTTPPVVNSVTVINGTQANLILQIEATLYNPSNTSLSAGETSFEIVVNNTVVGHASSLLSLVPGSNQLTLTSTVDPDHNPVAAELLHNYLGGQTSFVTLQGYENSTEVQSLSFALSQLKLGAPLPPLHVNLIGDSTMNILDASDAGVKATADVTMNNPFEASLDILTIKASVTVDGDVLAEISDDRTNNPIVLTGNKSTTVSGLPLNLNLDKTVLFGLLRRQAKSVGLDTSVIDALITIGKIPVPGVPPTTTIDPDKVKNFDIKSYTETALAKITTDMTLLSTVRVGEYEMPFPYAQLNTVTHTGPSIVKLVALLSKPIAQTLVDGSALSFDSLIIQDLAEDSFVTIINGGIKNAGPLPAVISFPSGADLVFDNQVLGTVSLPSITINEGQASLKNVKAAFHAKNKPALAAFTGQLLSSDSVNWTVKAENAIVNALKLPINGINMVKDVSLKGSNGFKNAVTVNSYDLPGDAPNGGITTTINATLANAGSVGITLGTVSFDVFSGTTKIGEVSTSGLSVSPLASSGMKLSGRLIPQSGDGLKVIAEIFSEVLAGKSIPLISKGTGLQPPISWLVPAITRLAIDTNLPPIKLGQLVTSVTLNELSMKFTPDTAYDPITSSKQITAQINIPFGFTLNILKMSEDIVLVNENKSMAKLSIPLLGAQTKGRNVTTSYTDIDLKVFDDAHDSFDSFVKDLTIGDSKTFGIVGSSDTITHTPVGTIPLNNISINVPSSLLGFKGFKGKPVNINSLDVVSGTPQVLNIPIKTSLFNPSPITISVGDVSFDVLSSNISMGHVVMTNLSLVPGDNNVSATTLLSPPSPFIAGVLISRFIDNISQPLSIVGTLNSTEVNSLKEAFSQVKIDSSLPPFGRKLLLGTFVQFQNDTLKTGIALGGFTIGNPFTTDITLNQMKQVNITFHDIPLGSISNLSIPFTVKGHSTFTSPPIPIKVSLSPANLVAIVKAAAADKGIDITPLLPLLKLIGGGGGGGKIPSGGSAPSQSPIELLKLILGTLDVNVTMDVDVSMDKFPAPLSIVQIQIPCNVSGIDTLVLQIAAPIAQGLVNGSTITVNSSTISNEQAASFTFHINGVVNNVGTIKSKITFPTGAKVSTNGKELGIAALPPIISDGSGVANINNDSAFQITNVTNFAQFTLILLGGPSATWTLAASDVQVDAFGIPLTGIQFSKNVTFEGFNGLKQLNVTGFGIPGKSKDGNLLLAINTTLTNPANVGIALGTITFNVFSGELLVGPITAVGVTLAPKSTAAISFHGEITIKDPKILSQLIAKLFSGNGTLTVRGNSISPPGAKGDVPWLSGPFKLLSLDVPISMGKGPINPVKGVTINSLDLAFTANTAFNPDSSSSGISAQVQLPIQLPGPITNVSQSIVITEVNGDKVASLNIPSSPATQVGDNVTTTYKNIPLTAIDKTAFTRFIGQLTILTEKEFNVSGTVTAAIGELTLPPIPFDVKTTMKGLQGFKSSPVTVGNVKVLGTSAQGVTLGMDVSLTNPSDVQVSAGDISLEIIFQNQTMGRATIKNIVLARGKNTYPATFLFAPTTVAAGKAGADLLGNFLTNKSSSLNIKGDGQTTNIPSLAPVFSLLSLDTTLEGLPVQIIESITITVDQNVLKTKKGLASFVVVNPLNVAYGITGITATASQDGKEIGNVNVPNVPTPIIVDPQSKKNVTGIPFTFTMNLVGLPGLIGKTILIDIDAVTSADVGSSNPFKAQIHITESKVPATILGSLGTTTTTTTTTSTTTTTTKSGATAKGQTKEAESQTTSSAPNPSGSVAPKGSPVSKTPSGTAVPKK